MAHEFRAGLVLCVLASVAPAADWPQWLGPLRDGSSVEIIPPWTSAPRVLWKQSVGEGHASPVVAGGSVYLHERIPGQDVERLVRYEAASGRELAQLSQTRAPFTSPFGVGPRATPALAPGDQVIALGVTGNLSNQVLSATAPPARAWSLNLLETFRGKNLTFGVSASPLLHDDRVYVLGGGKGAGLAAFERRTGKLLWKNLDDAASYAAPIAFEYGGVPQVAALTAEGVVAVNPANGELLWRHKFKDLLSESSTTPVLAGNLLIVSSVTLGSLALKMRVEDGRVKVEEAWKNPQLSCYFSTPAVVRDRLIFFVAGSLSATLAGKPEAHLHCVDAATGRIRWTQERVGKYHASLTRTGDHKLLMLSDTGELIYVDPDPNGYRELCRSTVCGETWAHPALSNGRLFIRDARQLIALQLQGGAP